MTSNFNKRMTLYVLLGTVPVFSIGSLSGCGDKQNHLQIGDNSMKPTKEETINTVQVGNETFLEFEFGDLHLRIRDGEKAFAFNPSDSRNRLLTWRWDWPSFKSPAGKDRPSTTEELSKEIIFRMAAPEQRQVLTDKEMTVQQTDNNTEIARMAKRFPGPFANNELRLLEYRRTNTSKAAMFYVADDESILTPAGLTIFAQCGETPVIRWGGYRRCVAGGSLSARVGYSYEFSDRLLPEWRLINSAVNKFIKEIAIEKK